MVARPFLSPKAVGIAIGVCVLAAAAAFVGVREHARASADASHPAGPSQKAKVTSLSARPEKKAAAPAITTNNAPAPTPTVINSVNVAYDPNKPSDGPYPALSGADHIWIDASIDQQLVYIMNGDKVIYTMITSSGLDTIPDNSTPLGVYHIEGERGTFFFSQAYNEGAKYWTSWLDHGVFLFHSVPTDAKGNVLSKDTAALGHPDSHGCFHLTIPDAKWIYENMPVGTPVVVEQAPVKLRAGVLYDPTPQQVSVEQTAPAWQGPVVTSG